MYSRLALASGYVIIALHPLRVAHGQSRAIMERRLDSLGVLFNVAVEPPRPDLRTILRKKVDPPKYDTIAGIVRYIVVQDLRPVAEPAIHAADATLRKAFGAAHPS